ncbi:MAG: S8 family serine peptidase, partial [Candidatus Limnocylindria bacterium]
MRFVRPPLRPLEQATTSEGAQASNALAWHQAGITGIGTKIAVIDTGFAGYLERQQSGDLPAGALVVDHCGGAFASGSSHGTAVAEVVHDLAPGAQLHLVCIDSEVTLGVAKDYAKAQGIHVINFSLVFTASGRGDGTGGPATPDGIAADARAAGILWVNAAGNFAQGHWSGTFLSTNGDGWHEFAANGDERNSFTIPTGVLVCVHLKWDEWPEAKSDYDLHLYNDAQNVLVASSETLSIGQRPVERVCYQNPGASGSFGIAIWRAAGTATPRLDLYISTLARLTYRTPAGSVLEPASSPAVLAVGAVCWQDGSLNEFSSQGPTIDGRVKPDIAGPSQVSTATFGPFVGCRNFSSGFFFTSAAAAHVAGAAALVKQANPSFTAAQLQSFLEARALDVGAPGKDDLYGSGLLSLGEPERCAPPDPTAATATNYLPNITKTLGGPSGFQTPFITQNTGAVGTTLEVSFYRFSDGSCVARRTVSALAPGASFADVPNNDADLPHNTQFSVVVRSFGAPIVSVVNQHAGTGTRAEAMSYVGFASGSTSVFLPNIVRRFFGYVTPFIIQNLGAGATTAVARFVRLDQPGAAPATVARSIGPGASKFVDPNAEPGLADGASYAVTVTADQPLAVVVNTHNDAPSVAAPVAYSANGIAAGAASVYGPYAAKN